MTTFPDWYRAYKTALRGDSDPVVAQYVIDACAAAVAFASARLPPITPTTVDICWISEYGLTQKLSNAIRCF